MRAYSRHYQKCGAAAFLSFFFQAEDGIRDIGGLEFRRVLFRSTVWTKKLCRSMIHKFVLEGYLGCIGERNGDRPEVNHIHRVGIRRSEGIFCFLLSDGVFEDRSEERRVGKECRSRWSPYH